MLIEIFIDEMIGCLHFLENNPETGLGDHEVERDTEKNPEPAMS